MRPEWFKGIFGHFFLRATLIQSVTGLLLLAVVLPLFNHFSDKLAAEQGRTFANSTLAATIDALYTKDFGQVVDYCMSVMKNTPNVEFILFHDKRGESLLITPQNWVMESDDPASGSSNLPIMARARSRGEQMPAWQTPFIPQRTFEFSRPIIIGGQEWGSMTIGFSKLAYLSSIQSFYWTVAGFTLLACLISFFMFYYSSRRVRTQIDTFGEIASQIADGKMVTNAPESAIGEIGTLGKAINAMSVSLKEKSGRIAELVKIVEQTNDAFVLFDSQRRVIFANEALREVTGYPSSHFIGMTLDEFVHTLNLSLPTLLQELDEAVRDHHPSPGHDVVLEKKDKSLINLEVRLEPITNSEGQMQNSLVVLSNINERKAAEAEIKSLAFYDPLTGLPNRRLLLDRLKLALAVSARSGRQGGLLFIDLDNFKTLNDTLGHDIGDLLLQQVARRLISCVREGDTVARLGGDEFVVMLEDLSEQEIEAASQTEAVGNKILATLNQPYLLGAHESNSSCSIGATLFNHRHSSLEELLKQADISMYQAKKEGRNALRFFDPKMQESINARALLEEHLGKAIEKQQFRLYFQVQIDDAGRALGAEALLRWEHPDRGLVMPLQFIVLAEETDLILPIGAWVIDAACAQLKAWQAHAIFRDLTLSVNVSARQIHQPEFPEHVRMAVQRHNINPGRLKLELTESLLLDNVEQTIRIMEELSHLGVKFSLDDFGTGYSSLQYLKRLPLHQLKIDKSFVTDIANDPGEQAIVRTIIAMARSLGLDVIAEGVETEVQQQYLLRSGCTHYQGYLYSKPLPLAQFESLLANGVSLHPA